MKRNEQKYKEIEGSEVYIRFKNGEEINLDCTKENIEKNYDIGKYHITFESTFLTEDSIKTLMSTQNNEVELLVIKKIFVESENGDYVRGDFNFINGELRFDKILISGEYNYKFNYVVSIKESSSTLNIIREKEELI